MSMIEKIIALHRRSHSRSHLSPKKRSQGARVASKSFLTRIAEVCHHLNRIRFRVYGFKVSPLFFDYIAEALT